MKKIEESEKYAAADKTLLREKWSKEAGDHKVKVKVGNQQGEFVLTIIVE
jgi:hypothetical protein